jgi:hypothetical protein
MASICYPARRAESSAHNRTANRAAVIAELSRQSLEVGGSEWLAMGTDEIAAASLAAGENDHVNHDNKHLKDRRNLRFVMGEDTTQSFHSTVSRSNSLCKQVDSQVTVACWIA